MRISLAIYPMKHGFGYATLQMPDKTLCDSGIVKVTPISNDRLLVKVKKFISYFKPDIIVLRDVDSTRKARRSTRISELLKSLVDYGTENNIPVYHYTRQQIRDVFEVFGATTKFEIAHHMITWFPELATKAPKPRKVWQSEGYHMASFDALSLAITHEYINE